MLTTVGQHLQRRSGLLSYSLFGKSSIRQLSVRNIISSETADRQIKRRNIQASSPPVNNDFARTGFTTKAKPGRQKKPDSQIPLFASNLTDKLPLKIHPIPEIPNRKPCPIPVNRMVELDACKPDGHFELMFATKEGLPVPKFPISHSAVAFYDPIENTYAVIGRQSPFDFSRWLVDGIRFGTQKDNEKKYLSKGFRFDGYHTGVLFSKAEMTSILEEADLLINQRQWCTMIHSNCYSYSVTVMSLALQCLAKRPEMQSEDVQRILRVMQEHPLKDHLSIGVFNNTVVKDQIAKACEDTSKRMKEQGDCSFSELLLLDQLSALQERVKPAEESWFSFKP